PCTIDIIRLQRGCDSNDLKELSTAVESIGHGLSNSTEKEVIDSVLHVLTGEGQETTNGNDGKHREQFFFAAPLLGTQDGESGYFLDSKIPPLTNIATLSKCPSAWKIGPQAFDRAMLDCCNTIFTNRASTREGLRDNVVQVLVLTDRAV